MISPFQREQFQIAIRLLQLDGDVEVWAKVADDIRHLDSSVPFGVSDAIARIKEGWRDMERLERDRAQAVLEWEREKAQIISQRAELLVALTRFLAAEKDVG